MKVKLQNVRLTFPNLWHAKEFKPGDGKPRFDATFLIEPGSDNDKKIQAAIESEAADKWKTKAEKMLASMSNNANKYCYLDGDMKEYEGYQGMKYLACHSKTRPSVFGADGSPLTEESGKIYAGCFVHAIVEIYAQVGENPGIRASFSGVKFFSDGPAFAGGAPAQAEDFDDLAQPEDASEFA
jgi:putative hemolysin